MSERPNRPNDRIPGWKDISTDTVTIVKNVTEAPEDFVCNSPHEWEPDWAGIVKQIEEFLEPRRSVGWTTCDEAIQDEIRLSIQDIIRSGCGYPRA